jgi:hypothetical protein
MKKITLFSIGLLFALQGCKKQIDPEMALTGTHNVSINHFGYGPDGVSGTKNFDETYAGTMEISSYDNGIYVVVKSSNSSKIECGLGAKNVSNDTIRYTSYTGEPGAPPASMDYITSTGNFSFSKSVYVGHRQSDMWIVKGKL